MSNGARAGRVLKHAAGLASRSVSSEINCLDIAHGR
jgi:hypothetical protein